MIRSIIEKIFGCQTSLLNPVLEVIEAFEVTIVLPFLRRASHAGCEDGCKNFIEIKSFPEQAIPKDVSWPTHDKTKRNMNDTTNALNDESWSLPVRQGYHAQLDCQNGVNPEAIIAACLDTVVDWQSMLEILEQKTRGVIDAALSINVTECSIDGVLAKSVEIVIDEKILSISNTHDDISRRLQRSFPTSTIPNLMSLACHDLCAGWTRVYGEFPGDDHSKVFIKIACALIAIHYVGIVTMSCTPLPLGTGNGESLLIARLLTGLPTFVSNHAVVDPAAAVLLRVLADKRNMENCTDAFVASSVGAGSGKSGIICRLIIGVPLKVNKCQESQHEETDWARSKLTLLEANLDDITAEVLAFCIQILLEKGAVDAWITPIVMKKGRPAHTISCLCQSSADIVDQLVEVLFRQSTTLGVRIHRDLERVALRRSFLKIQTPYVEAECGGVVDVKVGYLKDDIVSVKPEFDHCRAISISTGVPLKLVSDFATAEAYKQLGGLI